MRFEHYCCRYCVLYTTSDVVVTGFDASTAASDRDAELSKAVRAPKGIASTATPYTIVSRPFM
jgi:hypothetical protein